MASQLLGLGGVARDQACGKQEVRSARGWVSSQSAQAHRGAGAGGREVGLSLPPGPPWVDLHLLKGPLSSHCLYLLPPKPEELQVRVGWGRGGETAVEMADLK